MRLSTSPSPRPISSERRHASRRSRRRTAPSPGRDVRQLNWHQPPDIYTPHHHTHTRHTPTHLNTQSSNNAYNQCTVQCSILASGCIWCPLRRKGPTPGLCVCDMLELRRVMIFSCGRAVGRRAVSCKQMCKLCTATARSIFACCAQ